MKTHTTKDGKTMFISEMDDKHLDNTIKLIIRKITEAKQLLMGNIKLNKFKTALYKTKVDLDEDDLTEIIGTLTDLLPHYIMEASIRGVHYELELSTLFERAKADNVTSVSTLCISSSVISWDDQEEEWYDKNV